MVVCLSFPFVHSPDLVACPGGPTVHAVVRSSRVLRAHVQALPNVLVIQLKRFEFSRYGHKVSKKVDFDTTLDMAPYMSERRAAPAVYDLYGVLVHAGHSVHSGHYYCFVRGPNGMWHMMDDQRVTQVCHGKPVSAVSWHCVSRCHGNPVSALSWHCVSRCHSNPCRQVPWHRFDRTERWLADTNGDR
jgi:Ubiquitin carboxyl-terminal hydrolase